MTAPQRRLENAIAQAMVEKSYDLRLTYAATKAKYCNTAHWNQDGYYNRTLARQYARILAPRVAELLGEAA